MSVILITHHDENIYNLTKEALKREEHAKPYRSKFRSKSKSLFERATRPYATMGRPEEALPDPCNFLRKKSGMKRTSSEKIKHTENQQNQVYVRKPGGYPTREEIQKYNEEREKRSTKNFIRQNIKYVIEMKPKDPEKRIVLDRFGESKPLLRGLEPIYIKAPVYGKTPEYLDTFMRVSQKVYQQQKDAVGLEQPKCRYITQEEREKLLNGLKQNWEELQKQYQGLPILTDTIPKKNRKSKMEADLKQLEKDIVLIERHPYIYVYDDDELN